MNSQVNRHIKQSQILFSRKYNIQLNGDTTSHLKRKKFNKFYNAKCWKEYESMGTLTLYPYEYKQTTLGSNLALSFKVEHWYILSPRKSTPWYRAWKNYTSGPRDINNNVYSNLVQSSKYKPGNSLNKGQQENRETMVCYTMQSHCVH